MTVNYNFELEADDLFDDTFFENDFITSTAKSSPIKKNASCKSAENTKSKEVILENNATISKTSIKQNDKEENLTENNAGPLNKLTCSKDHNIINSTLSPIVYPIKETLSVNSQFALGFTPKPKKRKFPGLAGVYTQQVNKLQIVACDQEKQVESTETRDIASSQRVVDELHLPSWKNLQKDVSSCKAVLSTAKFHSIQKILRDTAKKKLPKHLVVPVLCVLVKKFKTEDSSLLLIDDTGVISGKVDKDVLEEYSEHIKVGTALILKKVTCLCNLLLIKKPTLASIYLEDGTVKVIHELSSVLNEEKTDLEIDSTSPTTPKVNENGIDSILKMCDSLSADPTSSLQQYESVCSSSFANSKTLNNIKSVSVRTSFPLLEASATDIAVINNKSQLLKRIDSKTTSSCPSSGASNPENRNTKVSTSTVPPVNKSASMSLFTKDSNDIFCDNLEMDEFDELLGSLDEKSFLAES